MGAEEVRDGANDSFGPRERVLGLGVTGLGTRVVGCAGVIFWSLGLSIEGSALTCCG